MKVLERRKIGVIGTVFFIVLLMTGQFLFVRFMDAKAQEEKTPKIQTEEGQPLKEEEEEEEEGVVEIPPESQQIIDETREFWTRENEPFIAELDINPFKVPPRKDQFEYYPCMDCHEEQETLPERELTEEHEDLVLDHGKKRFWCLTCHFAAEDKNVLRSLKDQKIDYDESHLLCGQCHFERQKDWLMGGHGKRIGSWYNERMILLCVECHNPHSPSIKPKLPDPIPKGIREIRLARSNKPQKREIEHELIKVWDRIALKYKKERSK